MQHEAQIGERAVDLHPARGRFDRTESQVAFHRVVGRARSGQRDGGADQVRSERRPEGRVRIHDFATAEQRDRSDHFPAHGPDPECRQRAIAMLEGDCDFASRQRRAGKRDLVFDQPAIGIEAPAQRFDADDRGDLEPNRLPDAGGALVPDAVRFSAPILFAAWLFGIVRIILGTHDDPVFRAAGKGIGNIERKGRLPAGMLADADAVDPNDRGVIDRSEAKAETFARRELRHVERSRVPEPGMKTGVVNAAQARFRRIWHRDPLSETFRMLKPAFGQSGVGIVERKAPDPGQIDPARTNELGIRRSAERLDRHRQLLRSGRYRLLCADRALVPVCVLPWSVSYGARTTMHERKQECHTRTPTGSRSTTKASAKERRSLFMPTITTSTCRSRCRTFHSSTG